MAEDLRQLVTAAVHSPQAYLKLLTIYLDKQTPAGQRQQIRLLIYPQREALWRVQHWEQLKAKHNSSYIRALLGSISLLDGLPQHHRHHHSDVIYRSLSAYADQHQLDLQHHLQAVRRLSSQRVCTLFDRYAQHIKQAPPRRSQPEQHTSKTWAEDIRDAEINNYLNLAIGLFVALLVIAGAFLLGGPNTGGMAIVATLFIAFIVTQVLKFSQYF